MRNLTSYQPAYLASSQEPKARQTAKIIGDYLDLPVSLHLNLHEHLRESVPFFPSIDEFHNLVRAFFSHPDERIFGEETASQALIRFQTAIHKILEDTPDENLLVVSHGTVISLLVSDYNAVDGFGFWRKLQLPDKVVLSLPDFTLVN